MPATQLVLYFFNAHRPVAGEFPSKNPVLRGSLKGLKTIFDPRQWKVAREAGTCPPNELELKHSVCHLYHQKQNQGVLYGHIAYCMRHLRQWLEDSDHRDARTLLRIIDDARFLSEIDRLRPLMGALARVNRKPSKGEASAKGPFRHGSADSPQADSDFGVPTGGKSRGALDEGTPHSTLSDEEDGRGVHSEQRMQALVAHVVDARRRSAEGRWDDEPDAQAWVCCDRCSKWRRLPPQMAGLKPIEGRRWECSMHPHAVPGGRLSRGCAAPEDAMDEDEVVAKAEVIREAEGVRLCLSSKSTTGYKGVWKNGSKFEAVRQGSSEQRAYLGVFDTAVAAALAVARAEMEADAPDDATQEDAGRPSRSRFAEDGERTVGEARQPGPQAASPSAAPWLQLVEAAMAVEMAVEMESASNDASQSSDEPHPADAWLSCVPVARADASG